MRLPDTTYRLVVLLAGATCALLPLCARAEEQAQNGAQPARGPLAPPTTLQVTGTPTKFTVSANHADVQSALKLVFDQAQAQFKLDSSVTGQVTLSLKDQPLRVTLDALCEQTFLNYSYSPTTHIYKFTRNEAAVKAAFIKLRGLNGQLLDNLQTMGLDVPSEPFFGGGRAYGGQGGSGGMENGVSRTGGRSSSDVVRQKDITAQSVDGIDSARRTARGDLGKMPSGAAGAAAGPSGLAGPEGPAKSLGDRSNVSRAGSALPNTNNRSYNFPNIDGSTSGNSLGSVNPSYQQFLAQNGYVGYRTQKDAYVPVTDLLKDLGQQANVPVLLDPNIPSSRGFRITGTTGTRPLPDTLNLLCPLLRLEWRWVGNTIFISPAPEFQVFWGSLETPRVTYPASAPGVNGKQGAPDAAVPASADRKRGEDKEAKPAGKGK